MAFLEAKGSGRWRNGDPVEGSHGGGGSAPGIEVLVQEGEVPEGDEKESAATNDNWRC
ncbi:MAG: hypothetical protein CM1200mP2_49170 [Planctomycetaceae bacterium]|nr:MAG: hypothetical protein CM1200mP2_49170 [Planctomycetaceae bacterium]